MTAQCYLGSGEALDPLPPRGVVMRQPCGYSKAVIRVPTLLAARTASGRASATAPGEAEETIVTGAFARYSTRRESADRAYARRRCDALPHPRQVACRRAQGRSARRSTSYEPEAERVCRRDADKRNLRDAMISKTPGLHPNIFLPHSTAPPDRVTAAAAARLGVPPECQSACLLMPPTPRKPG